MSFDVRAPVQTLSRRLVWEIDQFFKWEIFLKHFQWDAFVVANST